MDTRTEGQNDGRSDRRVVKGVNRLRVKGSGTGEDLCAEQGGKARHGDHERHVRRRGEYYALPEQAGHVQRILCPPYRILGCSSRHLLDNPSSSRAPDHLALVRPKTGNGILILSCLGTPGNSRSCHRILHWKLPGMEPQQQHNSPTTRGKFLSHGPRAEAPPPPSPDAAAAAAPPPSPPPPPPQCQLWQRFVSAGGQPRALFPRFPFRSLSHCSCTGQIPFGMQTDNGGPFLDILAFATYKRTLASLT
jgi:hypothetical protein